MSFTNADKGFFLELQQDVPWRKFVKNGDIFFSLHRLDNSFFAPAAVPFSAQSTFLTVSGNSMSRKQRFDLNVTLGDEAASREYRQTEQICVATQTGPQDPINACIQTASQCVFYRDTVRDVKVEFVGRARPYVAGQSIAIYTGSVSGTRIDKVVANYTCDQLPILK